MLNSPVFSGLRQPWPIYIKDLIPPTAHFSAPGKSPRCLFLLLQGLSRVRRSPARLCSPRCRHFCPGFQEAEPGSHWPYVCCRRFSIPHAYLSPHQKLIVTLYLPFPKLFFFFLLHTICLLRVFLGGWGGFLFPCVREGRDVLSLVLSRELKGKLDY